MPAFSSCNLWYEIARFLCSGNLRPAFYLLWFQCHKVASRVLWLWNLLQCHLLWVSSPFSPNHDPPLIYMDELTFTEFLWLRVFRTAAVSPFPQWAITALIPFIFDLNFTPLLGFSLHFHLYWPDPSQVPIFVKYHMSLSLGDKESTQLHASLPVQDLSNRCAVTGHQQALKEERC